VWSHALLTTLAADALLTTLAADALRTLAPEISRVASASVRTDN
jgi:hypothetical protein